MNRGHYPSMRVIVSRTLPLLLIALLTSVLVVESVQQATLEPSGIESTSAVSAVQTEYASPDTRIGADPFYANASINSTEPSSRPLGTSDLLIKSLLLGRSQKPIWLRLAESQRQPHGFIRTLHATSICIATAYRFAHQYMQSGPSIPVVFSRSLQSNSPPGFFPRL